MTKNRWKKTIIAACEAAGSYRTFFDPVIDTLAEILHKRDDAEALYKKSKAGPIVKHTNKSGATNIEQNPVLRLINDLNRDALSYWRELCLTPAAFKRLNEGSVKPPEAAGSALAKALKEIAAEDE